MSSSSAILSSDLDAAYGDAVDDKGTQREFIEAISACVRDLSRRPVHGESSNHRVASHLATEGRASGMVEIRNLPRLWTRAENVLRRFIALQSWSGIVLEVRPNDMLVKLNDETNKDAPESITSIRLEEIDRQDSHLVRPGAVFYWSIGYNDAVSGRERTSIIRFRRVPVWSQGETARAAALGDELLAFFGAGNGDQQISGASG